MSQLNMLFDPPGTLRQQGPRHDNDHAFIRDISILPTHDELTARDPPYLPANLMHAPHHLPPGSYDRELDVHFRLLREVRACALPSKTTQVDMYTQDLIAPLREITSIITEHLDDTRTGGAGSNQLRAILEQGGGRYRSAPGESGCDFNVYTGIEPLGLSFKASVLFPSPCRSACALTASLSHSNRMKWWHT